MLILCLSYFITTVKKIYTNKGENLVFFFQIIMNHNMRLIPFRFDELLPNFSFFIRPKMHEKSHEIIGV